MTYSGRIKNGVAVLDAPASLPDGTRVRIEVDPVNSDFWSEKTIAELAREQDIEPINDVSSLKMDWPDDDLVDDILSLIREVRH